MTLTKRIFILAPNSNVSYANLMVAIDEVEKAITENRCVVHREWIGDNPKV